MSIILGILASVLPNFVYKIVYFRFGVHTPQKIVKYLYAGVLSKYLGMALLVGLFLQWTDLNMAQFCISILVAECARWIYLFIKLRTTAT